LPISAKTESQGRELKLKSGLWIGGYDWLKSESNAEKKQLTTPTSWLQSTPEQV